LSFVMSFQNEKKKKKIFERFIGPKTCKKGGRGGEGRSTQKPQLKRTKGGKNEVLHFGGKKKTLSNS